MQSTHDVQFHARVARETIHWYHEPTQSWLTQASDAWEGFDSAGAPETLDHDWTPWTTCLNTKDHPYVRWFEGAKTNAAFNEIDRHVLAGHGKEVAVIEINEENVKREMTREELLVESAVRASELKSMGLQTGDRVLLHMTNSLEQVLWIEACKRLAVIVSATAIDMPVNTIEARLHNLRATAVLTHSAKGAAAKVHSAVDSLSEGGHWCETTVVDTSTLEAALDKHRQRLHPPNEPVSWARISSVVPAVPVEANFPLLVCFTSGSTGSPKGIVHAHAYISGLAHTMETVFGAVPGKDVIFVVANPGWITGQSYMISAALATRTTTVVMEGSAIIPDVLRFAAIVKQVKATIFKAGSTFIRHIMTSANTVQQLDDYHLTDQLRVATFCAEPVNSVVHQFAAKHICRRYINSYWGTEHGGIVWSTLKDDPKGLIPDAHSRCLPWIDGGVRIPGENRSATEQERGDVVINQPYPYLARTVWSPSESDKVLEPSWKGDLARWSAYFDEDGRFIEGDTCMQHNDGSYTFHGRSDEVMNIGGNRYGNEQIENAVLHALGDRVKNAVVVGMDDALNGITPVAVIVPHDRASWDSQAAARDIQASVIAKVARCAVPQEVVLVSDIPCTFSGKFMRSLIGRLLMGEQISPDDAAVDTVVNKECIQPLIHEIALWQRDRNTTRELNSENYVSPRSPAEQRMCDVWAKVLGLDRVGVMDEFEAIGGHSMLAMQIAVATSVSPGAILKYRTVSQLVANTLPSEVCPQTVLLEEMTWTPFPGIASSNFVQYACLTRMPSSLVASNAMLRSLIYHHIVLPGASDAQGRHSKMLETLFKTHPILTARARYPTTDLHFPKSADVDFGSHIKNSSEVTLEQLLNDVKGLYDRPLGVALVAPKETTLVLHHLVYDAHSLRLLKDTWSRIASGEVPVPTSPTAYPAIDAAVKEARDSFYTGPTGCEYFSALCHQCYAKEAALAPSVDPWETIIRPLMNRALKCYASSGEIYFELITNFRARIVEVNATNVCGNLTGPQVYHYDGQTFTPMGLGKCQIFRPRLVVNVVRSDEDQVTDDSNIMLFAPARRVIFVSMEPASTSWLAPYDLLPEGAATGISPIKVSMLQVIVSHAVRLLVMYFKFPQIIGQTILDMVTVMQLWGILQNIVLVIIASIIAVIFF